MESLRAALPGLDRQAPWRISKTVPHTRDSWWEIEIAADAHGLRFVREILAKSEVDLSEQSDRHVLRIPELDDIADIGVVRSRARSFVESLSGAAKLVLGWTTPIRLGSVLRRHPDGRADYFLEVDSVRMTIRSYPVTLRVTHSDGTIEERGPGEEVLLWLEHARRRESVSRVLRLVSEPELGWVELYRIANVVHEAAGVAIYDWVSKAELERFKHTANSVGAVGDAARHGRERRSPPKNPMGLEEARRLVSNLARS
jgi:hypothetical protein